MTLLYWSGACETTKLKGLVRQMITPASRPRRRSTPSGPQPCSLAGRSRHRGDRCGDAAGVHARHGATLLYQLQRQLVLATGTEKGQPLVHYRRNLLNPLTWPKGLMLVQRECRRAMLESPLWVESGRSRLIAFDPKRTSLACLLLLHVDAVGPARESLILRSSLNIARATGL